MEVNSAFLNGNLEEEIFMYQPQGFQGVGKECLVCRKSGFVLSKT